jgi:PAS domain S-box-containing protein
MTNTFDLFAQSPERLDANAVFQAAGLGFWELDPVTSTIMWDERCRSLLGLTAKSQLPYAEFITHIHPDDVDRIHTAIQQALTTHANDPFDQTYRILSETDTRSHRIRFMGRNRIDEASQTRRLAGVAFAQPAEELPTPQSYQNRHDHFQRMVEQASAAMALFTGPQLTVTIANGPMLTYWGRTSEQVLNRPLVDGLPESYGRTISISVMNVLTTGESAVISELAISADQNERFPESRYITLSLDPFRDAAGMISGVLAVGHDVTEQVVARQSIENRRAELMAAIDAAEISVWSLNVQTEQFRSNDQMKLLFGLPGTPEVDMRLFFNRIVAADRQRVLASFMHAFQYESGGRCEIQYEITHPVTGQKRTIRSRGQTQFDSNRVAQRFSCIVQDITVRQQAEDALRTSEARFRTLVNSIDNLAWIANADGWVYWYNQRWYDYTGTNLKEVQGWGWQRVHHPDHVNRVADFAKKAWEQGDPFDLTFPLRRHDGVYRWFLARTYPIKDAEGNIQQWVGSHTDIDEQKQVEANLEAQIRDRTAQLQVLVQDLQRSNDNLRQFAYVASHDLQEPLRKIQQFGDMLKSECSDQLGQGTLYLERMQLAAGRMSTLIRDLLSYSRIATQQDTTQLVSLQQIVDDVLADINLLTDEGGSTFRIDPLPTIPGDASQLGQLFQNLLSNALKFRQSGVQPIITITCTTVPTDVLPESVNPVRTAATYYQIDVIDNGIGFDEKYLDRIFQVFQRLHSRSEYAGTGIGLAICSKVVANHGGAITAHSQPGQGATFSLYFPTE